MNQIDIEIKQKELILILEKEIKELEELKILSNFLFSAAIYFYR